MLWIYSMNHSTNWKLTTQYVVLAVLAIWAVVLQVRLSSETVHLQRSLELYIPILIEPFTAKVYANDSMNWEKGREVGSGRALRRGDTVIKVNGRPFTGYSMYLAELWNVLRQPWSPTAAPMYFSITVLTKEGRTREIDFNFPHCTCGVPGLLEAVFFWMVAPLFCIAAGVLTVALRPNAVLAWIWFSLMLSLSQLQFWTEPYVGFQSTTDPMAIGGVMRVPAVAYQAFIQYSWPLALTIAGLHLGRKNRLHPLHGLLVLVLFLFAVAKAAVAIAWSEGFQSLSTLYFFFKQHDTQMLAVALVLLTAAAWAGDRKIGAVVGGITIFAIATLFAGPAPITEGARTHYSDQTTRFELSVPAFHRAPAVVIAASLAVFLLASLVLFRKRLSWQPAIGAALCLPLAAHVFGSLGNWWHPFAGPLIAEWPWIVALLAGVGLSLVSIWIIRRESACVLDRDV
jgi:hypothetical protein